MDTIKENETMRVLYEELRPDEFIERINEAPIAYLPLGTLEWHGRHLPLGTDGIESTDFFVLLAKKIGGVVLPMLFVGPDVKLKRNGKSYYGMELHSFQDSHFQQLPGNAYWIDERLFTRLLERIFINLARTGFKIVVAHGHGPSTAIIKKNKRRFEKKCKIKLLSARREDESDGWGMQTDHAAFNETSLLMNFRSDLVDLEAISSDPLPVGIGGEDPRLRASVNIGTDIIKKNLERMEGILDSMLISIKKNKKSIYFHHIQDLTDKNILKKALDKIPKIKF